MEPLDLPVGCLKGDTLPVPKLPAFDAKSFAKRLYEGVRKPNGDPFSVFSPEGPTSFPAFVNGLRVQRDNLERHDIQLADHKRHLDTLTQKQASIERRVQALEDAPDSPFPA